MPRARGCQAQPTSSATGLPRQFLRRVVAGTTYQGGVDLNLQAEFRRRRIYVHQKKPEASEKRSIFPPVPLLGELYHASTILSISQSHTSALRFDQRLTSR